MIPTASPREFLPLPPLPRACRRSWFILDSCPVPCENAGGEEVERGLGLLSEIQLASQLGEWPVNYNEKLKSLSSDESDG